jgi:aspartyl-tRNA(Asn)/glutamyl-tRNA(Gln) amidotransferase subunit A
VKNYETLAEIQQDLSTGFIQCKDLVDFYLKSIHSAQNLNIFLEVYEEEARLRAAEIDQKIAAGTQGKLAGLVLGIKDVICYRGHGLTAGSKILSGFESMFTATALQRLLAEDAIVIGRQNCDEFAMGSSNENSAYGPTRNPVDPERVPGGSSGASAAAVAANLCHASLGSDTGGSVRQPAGFCGTIGFKPTYGRVSRWGLIAYASSFDQIGPITKSVEDTARIMEVMAGPDQLDNTASTEEVPAYSGSLATNSSRKYKIAYIKEALESPGLDPEIQSYTKNLIHEIEAEGHEVKMVDFPYLDYVVPCYYILTTAEASSNLSRYDGVHYGYRSPKAQTLEEVYTMSRSEGFGDEVKRRIMLGTFVLSAGYYDAYYTKAMKVRNLIQRETLKILQDFDFILTPTAPTPAFKLGEKTDDQIEMFLSDIYTVHANLAGIPAISLPLGEHSNGLPFGIQFMGRAFKEDDLLSFSAQIVKK